MLSKFPKEKNYSNFNLEYYILAYKGNELYYCNIFNNVKVEKELTLIKEEHPSHEELQNRLTGLFLQCFVNKDELEIVNGGKPEVKEQIEAWEQIYPNIKLITNMVEQNLWAKKKKGFLKFSLRDSLLKLKNLL